jgi:hypothetical protein
VVHNLELALHFGDLVLQRRSLDDTCWLLAQQRAYSSRMQLAHAARACSSHPQSRVGCSRMARAARSAPATR